MVKIDLNRISNRINLSPTMLGTVLTIAIKKNTLKIIAITARNIRITDLKCRGLGALNYFFGNIF